MEFETIDEKVIEYGIDKFFSVGLKRAKKEGAKTFISISTGRIEGDSKIFYKTMTIPAPFAEEVGEKIIEYSKRKD